MIIRSLVLTAALALAVPLAAGPTRDWTRTVVATPAGFMIGNPQAKVKLVEYGSFTCPHCRAFQKDGVPVLKAKYVATGKVSFEFRSFVRNGPDYAVSLLAGCDATAPKQAANVELLFANQENWIEPFTKLDDTTAARIAALPKDKQVAELAKAGGLVDWMAPHGLPPTKAERCLADKAATDKLTATLKSAVETDKVDSTPNFLIDGVRQTTDFMGQPRAISGWAELEPRLVKALQ
ncbi:DsbA family protein [Sphingosinicellaceae bacterium]|nr:DsbA family protein [Sphingosinicellaceae bacterium]